MFVSVRDGDKPRILPTVRMLASSASASARRAARPRTSQANGVPALKINKVSEGRPHVVDAIANGTVQLVFNTTEGARRCPTRARSAAQPSCIRCPTIPLLPGPSRPRRGSAPTKAGDLEVRALQDYFA